VPRLTFRFPPGRERLSDIALKGNGKAEGSHNRGHVNSQPYDVAIVGAGKAGLLLARHLLLDSDKKILLLDSASELPRPRQELGESTVQIAGSYMSRVLDLEEYLLREHFLKCNLRFYLLEERGLKQPLL